jgi:sialic acid synthase SpsE
MRIGSHAVGPGEPTFVIAELSANHAGDEGRARRLVDAAAEAGADAIKLQTFTADTITLDADTSDFQIEAGTAWDGRTLHDLYR